MKRLLVLGATGGTGRQIVQQALENGHHVTVLARSPGRVSPASPRLTVLAGDVRKDGTALEEAANNQDAVISALGVGNSLKPQGLISDSVPRILRALEIRGIRRLIFISAYGVGETWRDVPFIPRIFMRLLLREVYADKEKGDEAIRRSNLDWTLVHPTTLADGPATGRYRAGERLRLSGVPKISRADVAHFVLSQIDDDTYLRRSVLVSR